MSTKVPIYLKRGSRKGKKEKLRDLLSSDMISPPLGDFRHTIHIGSGGGDDMFGDISFLQGKFHLLPGTAVEEAEEDGSFDLPFQFTRTTTVCGRELPDGLSPLLKNAISLPVIGGPRPSLCLQPRLHLSLLACTLNLHSLLHSLPHRGQEMWTSGGFQRLARPTMG